MCKYGPGTLPFHELTRTFVLYLQVPLTLFIWLSFHLCVIISSYLPMLHLVAVTVPLFLQVSVTWLSIILELSFLFAPVCIILLSSGWRQMSVMNYHSTQCYVPDSCNLQVDTAVNVCLK